MRHFNLEQKEIFVEGYEKVIHFTEKNVGLNAIIAIHSTKLGPALGGIRVYDYPTFSSALEDALRLAKGMTHKAAVAQTRTGGGKSVIIASQAQKTPELLQAFGEAVETFKGQYICAEDLGLSVHDLKWVRERTQHVVGLAHEKSSGDPSRFTTRGGFLGMKFVAEKLWDGSLEGKTVVVQGLGATGMKLVEALFWEKARIIVADISEERSTIAQTLYGVEVVSTEEVLFQECDILAPCAMGGILTEENVPFLGCKAVCGIANNQLLTERVGDLLHERGILYIPDFIANSGGLINVALELEKEGYNPCKALSRLDAIVESIEQCFEISQHENVSMSYAAMITVNNHLLKGPLSEQTLCYHH